MSVKIESWPNPDGTVTESVETYKWMAHARMRSFGIIVNDRHRIPGMIHVSYNDTYVDIHRQVADQIFEHRDLLQEANINVEQLVYDVVELVKSREPQ